jgi:3-deoxy-D-arabino-heptulosonate 7-phosphate (DAHP) synthase
VTGTVGGGLGIGTTLLQELLDLVFSSVILLGDRLSHTQLTERETEDQRHEGIVNNPAAELGFKGRSTHP